MMQEDKIVSAAGSSSAAADKVFEFIADPALQPEWDGNDNLSRAAPGQRVRAVGDEFTMHLTNGAQRVNHVVEFIEGRTIAWRPAPVDSPPPGHLWRWELTPRADGGTHICHTYDWSELTDPGRFDRARSTTTQMLQASIDRLVALVEREAD